MRPRHALARRSLTVLAAALLLALAACGGSDPPEDEGAPAGATPTATSAQGPDSGSEPADDSTARRDPSAYAVFKRLEVDPGGYPVKVSGNVVRGEKQDAYLVAAPGGAGEQLAVKVTALEDNASFFVYGPDDTELAADQKDVTLDLVEAGEYLVVVGPTRGNTTYELSVSVSVPAT